MRRSVFGSARIFAATLFLCGVSSPAHATIWYVNASQTTITPPVSGYGESWEKAFPFLQDALTAASAGDTIRVGQGVYRPDVDDDYPTSTHTTGERDHSFVMKDEVLIQGGWEGVGNPGNWDPATYITILSGDLGEPDDPEEDLNHANREDNSKVVVRAGTTTLPVTDLAVLDGFIIEGGHHFDPDGDGAGLYVPVGSYPRITNCIFRRNAVPNNRSGGGMFIENGHLEDDLQATIIESTVFEDNQAGNGGGLMVLSSYVQCTHVDFIGNRVYVGQFHGGGGGFDLDASVGRFTQCHVIGNSVDGNGNGNIAFGGGGMVRKGASLLMKHSRVADNTISGGTFIHSGGGIAALWDSHVTIVNTEFDSNIGEGVAVWGGGIYIEGSDIVPPMRLINCVFKHNEAINTDEFGLSQGGGAMILGTAGSTELTNVLMFDNYADEGAAVYTFDAVTEFVNCTLANNSAWRVGGGIYFFNNSMSAAMTLTNCVLWGNTDGETPPEDIADAQLHRWFNDPFFGPQPVVTYSCIEDDDPDDSSIPFGGGSPNFNIDDDPTFVNATIGDYRLAAASPCIDTGDTPAVPLDVGDVDDNANTTEPTPLDVALRPRFVAGGLVPGQVNACDGVVDMGAHEFAYGCDDCIRMGDMNYDGLVDGADIQPFVDCALDGDGGAECGCACGDFVGRNGVEVNDVPSFVACLLSGGEGCVTPEPCDFEGEPRAGLLDCNENEVHDEVDIHFCDPSVDPGLCDCNGNGIPDACDIADCDDDWTCGDVNENGIPDGCEPDCNGNEIPDDVDIANCGLNCATGGSIEVFNCCDCNGNGIPDGCEPDCNENGIPDDCDIDPLDPDGDEWISPDCNGNGIPDGCEPDCNENGVPDDCDVDPLDPDGDEWVSADCNGNGWPDECDIDMGPPFGSMDCNENGIPDECDIAACEDCESGAPADPSCCDCNENGIPDGCDIAAEISEDMDENGIPDECETEMMMMGGEGGHAASGNGSEASGDCEMALSEGGEQECRDAAWAAFHQWCMGETWGPHSEHSGIEQLRRLMEKRAALGL